MKAMTTRRLFFWKAGAALSAPLAVAAGDVSAAAAEDGKALRAQLSLLEDMNAIRELNAAFTRHIVAGSQVGTASLLADGAAAPLDGLLAMSADPRGPDDVVEIAPDRQTAIARMHRIVQIEKPIEPPCPLVEMAQEQGGGVVRRSERRVLEATYVKRHGVWKIDRLTYRTATPGADSSSG